MCDVWSLQSTGWEMHNLKHVHVCMCVPVCAHVCACTLGSTLTLYLMSPIRLHGNITDYVAQQILLGAGNTAFLGRTELADLGGPVRGARAESEGLRPRRGFQPSAVLTLLLAGLTQCPVTPSPARCLAIQALSWGHAASSCGKTNPRGHPQGMSISYHRRGLSRRP